MKKKQTFHRILCLLIVIFGGILWIGNRKDAGKVYIARNTSRQYQEDFIEMLRVPALESYERTGVLPSITIAQAILESSWGRSALSQDALNFFGIKGTYQDASVYVTTQEYTKDGTWITIKDTFKKYPSITESLIDHGNLLLSEHYQGVVNQSDYKAMAHALSHSGYATDPDYAEKLIDLIKVYQLHRLDPIHK